MLPRFLRAAPLAPLLLSLAALLGTRTASADEPKPAPKAVSPLSIEAIRITPAAPGPDTLCHLAVTLRNAGDHAASRFELRVKVGGVELPAYRGRVFLAAVPPHGNLELPLLNFWSTESSRKAPADGKLAVEVALLDARWVERTVEGGIETWRPLAPDAPTAPPGQPAASAPAALPIPGLPVAKSVTLTLAAPPAPQHP